MNVITETLTLSELDECYYRNAWCLTLSELDEGYYRNAWCMNLSELDESYYRNIDSEQT